MALDTMFMQLNPTLTTQVACFVTWMGYSNCKAEVQDGTPPCSECTAKDRPRPDFLTGV